jgi:hypothetical protein
MGMRQNFPTQDAPSLMRSLGRAVRYSLVFFGVVALSAGVNAILIWITDQLLSRS